MIFIIGLLLIKFAALLNNSPSPKSNKELIVKWTFKKTMRNNPVILMKNFCPMDEVKNLLIEFNFYRTLVKLQISLNRIMITNKNIC
jgi:hypothetical protein